MVKIKVDLVTQDGIFGKTHHSTVTGYQYMRVQITQGGFTIFG